MKTLKDQINVSTEWPDGYPEELKPISWQTGEIAGPHKTWNKYISPQYKYSKDLVLAKVLDFMFSKGMPIEVCHKWCNWLTKRISVIYKEETADFVVYLNKKKFDKAEFYKVSKQELAMDEKTAEKYAVKLCKYLKAYYDEKIKEGK